MLSKQIEEKQIETARIKSNVWKSGVNDVNLNKTRSLLDFQRNASINDWLPQKKRIDTYLFLNWTELSWIRLSGVELEWIEVYTRSAIPIGISE
jgi:hypothetical protein